MNEEDVSVCEECGASVYPEQVESGIAGKHNGKLLCSHCMAETEDAEGGLEMDDLAPIEFDEDEDDSASTDMSSTRIHAVSGAARGDGLKDDAEYKRPLDPKGVGASRCRMFHCRISQGAVDFMVNQMNEWLDEHNDVTIKFATTTIGMFEGKHTEPNLITTVFY
jgi:hypothetical protein